MIGIRNGCTTVWPCGKAGQVGQVLGNRFAGDRQAIAVDQLFLEQQLHHGRRAADLVQIFLHVFAAGPQVGQIRHAVARALEVVDRERHIDGAGHRDEMHHGVRRAADGHHDRHRIFERLAGHHVARLDVLFHAQANRRAGTAAFVQLAWIGGRQRRAVRQRHAQRFDRRGHRVGRVHAAARAGTGAGVAHDVAALGVGHLAHQLCAVACERRDDIDRLAVGVWPARIVPP